MQVKELLGFLPLTVVSPKFNLDVPLSGGYASDLLSNVLGQARPGSIWITVQGHQNVIAVALQKRLAAVLIAGGFKPDSQAIRKAEEEGVVLLTTDLPVFEVVGKLYSRGITGQ